MLHSITTTMKTRLAQRKDEDGVALITLIGVTLITFILMATITTSTTLSVFSTNMQLSQQQARANAESGLQFAEQLYTNGNTYNGRNSDGRDTRDFCDPAWKFEDEDYNFTFEFKRVISDTIPANSTANNVRDGCPLTSHERSNGTKVAADNYLMVVATGKGNNNTTSTVMRVYENIDYESRFIPENTVINAESVNLREAGNIHIGQASGVTTQPAIQTSNLLCENSGNTPHQINAHIAADGNVKFNSNCVVSGDVLASSIDTRTLVNGDTCARNSATNTVSHLADSPSNCLSIGERNIEYSIPSSVTGYDSVAVNGGANNSVELIEEATTPRIVDARAFSEPSANRLSNQTITVNTDVVFIVKSGIVIDNLTVKAGKNGGSLSFLIDDSNSATNEFNAVTYEDGATGAINVDRNGGGLILRNSSLKGWVSVGNSQSVDIRGTTSLEYYPVGLPVSGSYDMNGAYYMPTVRVK